MQRRNKGERASYISLKRGKILRIGAMLTVAWSRGSGIGTIASSAPVIMPKIGALVKCDFVFETYVAKKRDVDPKNMLKEEGVEGRTFVGAIGKCGGEGGGIGGRGDLEDLIPRKRSSVGERKGFNKLF